MRAFLCSFFLVQVVLVLVIARLDPGVPTQRVGLTLGAAWLLLVLPLGGSLVGVHAADLLAPRAALLAEHRRVRPSISAGLAAGVAHVGVAGALVILVDGHALDAPGILVASAATSFAAASVLPRVRAGRCVACGYDLRGAIGERCPECGLERMGGEFLDELVAPVGVRVVLTCRSIAARSASCARSRRPRG